MPLPISDGKTADRVKSHKTEIKEITIHNAAHTEKAVVLKGNFSN